MDAIQAIPNIVDISDINLWMACLLNNQGFIYDHPVMKTITGGHDQIIRTKEDMCDHMSTALFARILIWGHHTYTLHNVRYFPPDFHYKQDLTGSKEGMRSTKNSKSKKSSTVFTPSANDNLLPEISQIQKLLKQSILDLDDNHFSLLQCCIMDLYCLQAWTQPFSKKAKSIYDGVMDDDTPNPKDDKVAESTPGVGEMNDAWKHYQQHKLANTPSAQKATRSSDDDDDDFDEDKNNSDDKDEDESNNSNDDNEDRGEDIVQTTSGKSNSDLRRHSSR